MVRNNFNELFSTDRLSSLSIRELAEWHSKNKEDGCRLLLPPIQRSIVWSNEQIVNYWDSLLRGYPAGTMIVHRTGKCENGIKMMGRDAVGKTILANENDFQLFDGQQRMTAILLGLGIGQMRDSRKLWIDIGKESNTSSGLKFQLRMTSTGQPFGYRLDAPNYKIELSKRRDKWKEWKQLPRQLGAKITPQRAFKVVNGKDLIDAKCVIAFEEVYSILHKEGIAATSAMLSRKKDADPIIAKKFLDALKKALANKVVLQEIGAEIVVNQDEYIRFFGRVGQGGSPLSDDELTYSIIKQQYPEIHDQMQKIIKGKVGRLASEVDLVLAALRVAKTLAPWDNAGEWEVISRPTPTFVAQLKASDREATRSKFLKLVGLKNQTSIIEKALTAVRQVLSHNKVTNPEGLPSIMLASLPSELVDVLLLIALKRWPSQKWTKDDHKTLSAFVLYWLLFVNDNAKAARCVFLHAKDEKWSFSQVSMRNFISEFENDGFAYFLPRQRALIHFRNEVKKRDVVFRFSSLPLSSPHSK